MNRGQNNLNRRKEYLLVGLIVFLVVAGGLISSSRHQRVITQLPDK
jgi:hypothetical protein